MNLYSSVFLLLMKLNICTEFVTDRFNINTSPVVIEIIFGKQKHKFIAEISHFTFQHPPFDLLSSITHPLNKIFYHFRKNIPVLNTD